MSANHLYNEKEILIKVANGDEQAFSSLYLGYYNKIYSVSLMYLKAHELAEDITQQVFMKLWEQRSKLSAVDKLDSFLFIIARNEICNILRKHTTQENYRAFIRELILQEVDTPEDLLIIKQKGNLLERLVATLPERQQKAFRLNREKGLRYQQIADEMNISIATVKEHISKALQQIKTLLVQHKDELFIQFIVYQFFL